MSLKKDGGSTSQGVRAAMLFIPNKSLISVIITFYSNEVISEAKVILLTGVETLNLDINLTRRRRESDTNARASKEVNDIILLWSHLDQNGLLAQLPRYVVKNLQNTPPMKMEAGEYKLLCSKIEHLTEQIEKQRDAIDGYFNQLRTQSDIFSDITSSLTDINQLMNIIQSDMSMRLSSSQIELRPCVQTMNASPAYYSIQNASMNSNSNSLSTDHTSGLVNAMAGVNYSKGLPRYSDVVRFSQPRDFRRKNDDSQASSAGDEESYQTAINKRNKRRRAERLAINSETSETPPKPAGQERIRTEPLLIGKGGSASNVLKAARSIIPKRVFYVGNLDVKCKETHIKTMLEQLNIAVKTVNKLGKGKDKEKDMVKDTNNDKADDTTGTKVPWYSAFRVCIEAKDEARFLDESIWSNDVVIRNWNFNPKSSNVPNVPKAKQPNQRMSPGTRTRTAHASVAMFM